MKWFSTPHCRSGAHCQACRNSEAFRQSLLNSGFTTERDFSCPFGISPPSPLDGPGTRLARILTHWGFRQTAKCACKDMVLLMNLWGPEICRARIDEIIDVMRAAATEPESNPKGIPFVEWIARKIILHCAKE